MASPRDDPRPMVEPGKHPQGADVGGVRSNADGGLEDALQRSAEHRDDAAAGAATAEGSSSGTDPRIDLGGKDEPGSAPGPATPSQVRKP